MPYHLIVPIIIGILVWRHLHSSAASTRSKLVVLALALGAFLAGKLLPVPSLATFAVFLAVGVYVTVCQIISDGNGKGPDSPGTPGCR